MNIDVTINIAGIDFDNVLSSWKWRIPNIQSVVLVSCLGDVFYVGDDGGVYWLQTDCGDLTRAADDLAQFEQFLHDEEKVDDWFLPGFVEKLVNAGKVLKAGEVYSYLKLPVIGGTYSVENIAPTDVDVHFTFSGQICEQIRNLPDGTKVRVNYKK
ncbi:MAG: DUF1851 domain-containing protein [Niastella sp.]|nr:DUF1851 domain-containing protein [Niastella sp.]